MNFPHTCMLFLPSSLKKSKVMIGADDTNISNSSKSLEGISQALNSELSHLTRAIILILKSISNDNNKLCNFKEC